MDNTLPIEPGYYWRKGPNFDGEHVEQIVKVDCMIRSAPEELFYWEAGELGGIYVKEELGTTWWGPIPTIEQFAQIRELLEIAVASSSTEEAPPDESR